MTFIEFDYTKVAKLNGYNLIKFIDNIAGKSMKLNKNI